MVLVLFYITEHLGEELCDPRKTLFSIKNYAYIYMRKKIGPGLIGLEWYQVRSENIFLVLQYWHPNLVTSDHSLQSQVHIFNIQNLLQQDELLLCKKIKCVNFFMNYHKSWIMR